MAVFAVGKPFAVARQQDARPQHTHGRPQKFRKRTTTFVEAEVQHRGAAVTWARKAFPGEYGWDFWRPEQGTGGTPAAWEEAQEEIYCD